MNLSPAQIAPYAANAGFAGPDLATAVAIALAESSGNPAAYDQEAQDVPGRYNRISANDGLGSVGLWQIYLAANPQFAGEDLTDPQINAGVAYVMYSNHGFSPWASYTSGTYQKYMPTVLVALQPAPAPSTPLTLDAATGLPVVTQAELAAGAYVPPFVSTSPSLSSVLIWGALGLFALWAVSESF